MADLQRHIVPRGNTLPIERTYPYGGDGNDLPEGYELEWVSCEDPEPREAGFRPATLYIEDHGRNSVASFNPERGGEPVSYMYLRDPEGALVATWDEGRWWTPDESAAFLLMIRVPETYFVAEGMRRSGLNRQQRRRKL